MTESLDGSSRKNTGNRRVLAMIVAGWLVMLGVIIGGMLLSRSNTLRAMSTPEAQAEWDAWRESEVNQRDDLPVKRRPPKSAEPPALVLMRDHFPVLLGAAVVFGSLLYGALAFALRGSMQSVKTRKPFEPPPVPSRLAEDEKES